MDVVNEHVGGEAGDFGPVLFWILYLQELIDLDPSLCICGCLINLELLGIVQQLTSDLRIFHLLQLLLSFAQECSLSILFSLWLFA